MNELLILFFTVLVTEFFAEMGDKTQLMLIGLTSKYKLRDIVWGTFAAVLVLNGLAVFAGGLVSEFVPDWLIKLVAASAFLYFSVTSLKVEDEEDEEAKETKIKFAPLAVFCTFFVAELGDKTQLTAITFGANNGIDKILIVWLACSIGLFAADIIGLLIGLFLKKNIPEHFMHILAYVLFCVFGFSTLREALNMLNDIKFADGAGIPVLLIMVAVGAVFIAFSVIVFIVFDFRRFIVKK